MGLLKWWPRGEGAGIKKVTNQAEPMRRPPWKNVCNQTTGTFYHLQWQCSTIQTFWTQVIRFLHDTMGFPITLQPKLCLLGIFPEPELDTFTKIFLNETLFSAKKFIARVWMRPNPPELSYCIAEVNNALPYKKLIYSHRGCPSKYERIWDRWLKAPETCV